MCGIAGTIDFEHHFSCEQLEDTTRKMTASLHHRGPDRQGVWHDKERGIGLGHRRLAIVDLSQNGNQPMISRSGRYVVVYNGEIYNFVDLKKQYFQAWPFQGTSDTEVLLAAIENWGIESALEKIVGMFAIAIWDRLLEQLILARDRVGKKPIYYSLHGGFFSFASELKALKQHPAYDPELSKD